MNTEKSKSIDALYLQTGVKQGVSAKSEQGDSFKDTVKKAVDQKNGQTVSEPTNKTNQKNQINQAGQIGKGNTKEAAETQPGGSRAATQVSADDSQIVELVALMMAANVAIPQINMEMPKEAQTVVPQQGITFGDNQMPQATATQQMVSNVEVVNPNETLTRPAAQVQESVTQQTSQIKQNSKSEEPVAKEQARTEKQVLSKSEEPVVKISIKHEGSKETAAQKQNETEVKHEFLSLVKQEPATDTGKVYVKVGDGQNIDSEKFASDVSENIAAKLSQGKQQFEIELLPQELGKIVIKLVMQNGKAEIMLHCLNPKTQQLIAMNADSIRAIVEERTGMNTILTLKEDAESARNDFNGKDGQENQNGQKWRQDKEMTEAEAEIFLNQLRLGLAESEVV